MLFCSQAFLVFFTVVFSLYWALPWHRARMFLLLAASFFFYACWNHWLALLIGVSTFGDYWLARGMDAASSPFRRRLLLTVSIVANLGLLTYFKYANFFLESLEAGLASLGVSTSMPVLRVILPVGISFYTFEAINYTVDVYRRRLPAERNLIHFMLFITFFPHLVAGPIVRAHDFLPQIRRRKRWNWSRMHLGVQLFLMGLFKKLVVADRMAQFADPVFADPEAFKTSAVWLAVVAYALQIYGDFSGYTDMALGCAHLLGFHLAKNFDMPYLAVNISDFWRRWHISLSTWLRDYLFIPLGGSRGGPWRTARNLLITMTLGGLWHGASWTFVLWGIVHGLLLIGHRLFAAAAGRVPALVRAGRTLPGWSLRVALTFFVVCLTWVLFRAVDLATAGTIFRKLFHFEGGLRLTIPSIGLALTVGVMALAHLAGSRRRWLALPERLPAPLMGAAYCLILSATLVLSPQSGQAFIYFQF